MMVLASIGRYRRQSITDQSEVDNWNDVWRSIDRGATWTKMTPTVGWTPRSDHTSVVLPDGSIVLMGGRTGPYLLKEVWRSTNQGTTWTRITAVAGWAPRWGHTSVVLSDGSIVLMGGNDGSNGLKDVWRLGTGIGPVPPGVKSIYLPLLVYQLS
jgi:hypothetical protein